MINNNKEIKNIVNQLKQLSQIELTNLKEIVDNIVQNNIKDEWLIEHTLDRLLNLYFIDELKIRPIYMNLINYYKNINLDASEDYMNYYLQDFEIKDDSITRKITKEE